MEMTTLAKLWSRGPKQEMLEKVEIFWHTCAYFQTATRKHNFRSPISVSLAWFVEKFSLYVTVAPGATLRGTIENLFTRSVSSLLKPVAQRMDQLTPQLWLIVHQIQVGGVRVNHSRYRQGQNREELWRWTSSLVLNLVLKRTRRSIKRLKDGADDKILS